ncbi:MAG: bifunctional riboflavin kinase/FAD synthetase [Clostridium butyricum]|nr:bifunctional riboflavin kinase/FAD synthetase [Clostridium butyricum]
MIVIDENADNMQSCDNYIALGSFDGLHLGHLSLIYKVKEEADRNGGKSIVYTFKNHPRTLISKNSAPKLLMDNDEKIKILNNYGVDIVYFQDFNQEFMKLTPEEFVKMLIERFNAKGLVVGFNYKFGYKNSGNIDLLQKLQKKYNYELYVMEPCTYKNEVISSTRIRKVVEEGNVEEAYKMLNRPYCLKGNVIHGRKIGRTIGFPTANLSYDKKFILPSEGVYYTNVKVNNKLCKAITSVGYNPTVGGKVLTIESHILNFKEDIYEKNIEVNFIKKIRDNIKFNGINELKNQLEKDKSFAKMQNYMSSLRI